MAKFGQFVPGGKTPVQEFEGDRMTQNQEYVYIFKRDVDYTPQNLKEHQVAAIKLADGQSVKKISD